MKTKKEKGRKKERKKKKIRKCQCADNCITKERKIKKTELSPSRICLHVCILVVRGRSGQLKKLIKLRIRIRSIQYNILDCLERYSFQYKQNMKLPIYIRYCEMANSKHTLTHILHKRLIRINLNWSGRRFSFHLISFVLTPPFYDCYCYYYYRFFVFLAAVVLYFVGFGLISFRVAECVSGFCCCLRLLF